jgi:hypothetical protein
MPAEEVGMYDERMEGAAGAGVSRVRARGRRLWRVLVVGGLAISAACAGNQKSASTSGGSTGSATSPNGEDPGPGDSNGHGHGSGAGGW